MVYDAKILKVENYENYFLTRDSVKIEKGQLTAIGPSSVIVFVIFYKF